MASAVGGQCDGAGDRRRLRRRARRCRRATSASAAASFSAASFAASALAAAARLFSSTSALACNRSESVARGKTRASALPPPAAASAPSTARIHSTFSVTSSAANRTVAPCSSSTSKPWVKNFL